MDSIADPLQPMAHVAHAHGWLLNWLLRRGTWGRELCKQLRGSICWLCAGSHTVAPWGRWSTMWNEALLRSGAACLSTMCVRTGSPEAGNWGKWCPQTEIAQEILAKKNRRACPNLQFDCFLSFWITFCYVLNICWFVLTRRLNYGCLWRRFKAGGWGLVQFPK